MSLESIAQQVREEISRLNEVLHLLEGNGAKPARNGRRVKARRNISADGRKRIAAAQRARWAKIRAAKK